MIEHGDARIVTDADGLDPARPGCHALAPSACRPTDLSRIEHGDARIVARLRPPTPEEHGVIEHGDA
ncbi:MAG: hypothetical protein ACPL89_16370, partial [Roseiflexus castenholzii]